MKCAKTKIAELVRTPTLAENARIEHMYQTLQKLDGLGEDGVTNASITIDEILYSNHIIQDV